MGTLTVFAVPSQIRWALYDKQITVTGTYRHIWILEINFKNNLDLVGTGKIPYHNLNIDVWEHQSKAYKLCGVCERISDKLIIYRKQMFKILG